MAGTNDFKPFAVDVNANLVSQAVWDGVTLRPVGNVPGTIANAALVNKALRQGTLGTASIGEFITSNSTGDALDTGDPLTLMRAFTVALSNVITRVLFDMGYVDDNWRALVEDIIREVLPFRLDPSLPETCLLGYDPTSKQWIWVPLSSLEGGGTIIPQEEGFYRVRVGSTYIDAGATDNDLFDNASASDLDIKLWNEGEDADFADPITHVAGNGTHI